MWQASLMTHTICHHYITVSSYVNAAYLFKYVPLYSTTVLHHLVAQRGNSSKLTLTLLVASIFHK